MVFIILIIILLSSFLYFLFYLQKLSKRNSFKLLEDLKHLNLSCIEITLNIEKSNNFTLVFGWTRKANLYFNEDLLIITPHEKNFLHIEGIYLILPLILDLKNKFSKKTLNISESTYCPYHIKLDRYDILYISVVKGPIGITKNHLEIKFKRKEDVEKLKFLNEIIPQPTFQQSPQTR